MATVLGRGSHAGLHVLPDAIAARAAWRTMVEIGSVGPSIDSPGRGSRMTHFSVSTCALGTSETKSLT